MADNASRPPSKAERKKPKSEEDWFQLTFEISSLFDGAPVDEEDLFAGRLKEVRKIIEAVIARSKHVVLFGEKGVGKTSLTNVFWKRYSKTLRSFIIARVQAGPHDNFSSL
jgi:ATP-dependent Clp protease ATP-binding subunit ClpA